MIDTTRIRTGFDVEVNLGAGWILVALRALNETGRLLADAPSPFDEDATLSIDSVEITPDGPRDIEVGATIDGIPVTILATLSLQEGDDGTELVVDTTIPNTDPIVVPFDALADLAEPPVLVKLDGDDGIDPSFAVLANLDLRASPQSGDPLPEDQHVPRGEPLLAQSFLPEGSDITIGVGRDTFPRFANDVWHTQLRVEDGSHPLPDEQDKRGEWKVVRMEPRSKGFRLTMLGTVPIDLFPDGKVTVTVDLTPRIENGALAFDFDIDTDVDTGLLGDLWSAVLGGFVGLILGAFTGGILITAGTGAILAVVALEVTEVIVNGKVRKQVRARLEDEPLGSVLSCSDDEVIVEAIPPDDDDGVALGPLDAIPRSILIDESNPDPVHTRFVLVTTTYTDFAIDGSGFAALGTASGTERFVPRRASLVRKETGDNGERLVYETLDPDDEEPATIEVDVDLAEAIDRATEGGLNPPLRLYPLPAEADQTLVDGKIPSVCLRATNVRRARTVVTDIRFDTGLELTVPEAVALQDAGAIVVAGTQLIHPRNSRPYFRSFPDGTTENNFENLPPF